MERHSHNSTLRFAQFTHVGTVHPQNEDTILCAPHYGLWAVADGMGGHQEGQFASQRIVHHLAQMSTTLNDSADPVGHLQQCLAESNHALYQYARLQSEDTIVGSTVVALWLSGDVFHVLWSGDSPCYLLRDDTLSLLTPPHVDPMAPHILTRAIGGYHEPEIDYYGGTIYENDRFLLCSDGINKVFSDADIKAHLSADCESLDAHCEAWLQHALTTGSPDNISAIVIDVGGS
ncbi:MAG: serine/threonine-protein phosphatase [Gammaproteobacteria bacterium]